MLDQPTYKTWQHGRKPDAEGKGDSPRGPQINCEDMRMLSARTGDKLRAISQEILGWRAVYTERRKYGSERGTRHTRKGQRSLLYSKTGSVCGRRASAIWSWNCAVPCTTSGCA